MFNINQGFSLKSPQFNFERDYFADLASLKAASENDFPDYFITNVAGVLYQLNKSNLDDPVTGKWRKFSTAAEVSVDDNLNAESANPVQNKVIAAALNSKLDTATAESTYVKAVDTITNAEIEGLFK